MIASAGGHRFGGRINQPRETSIPVRHQRIPGSRLYSAAML
jgi:hypothetical protein